MSQAPEEMADLSQNLELLREKEIVVIGQDPNICIMYEQLLRLSGANVIHHDTFSGINILNVSTHAVVYFIIHGDGTELQELVALKNFARIPVVAVSLINPRYLDYRFTELGIPILDTLYAPKKLRLELVEGLVRMKKVVCGES